MIYLDTSSFLDLYLVRDGVEQIKSILLELKKPIIVGQFVELEFNSVLGRLVSQKEITQHQRLNSESRYFEDLESKLAFNADQSMSEIIERSIELTRKKGYHYRTMDTVHVVSAKLLKADLFITSDEDQYELANKISLKSRFIKKNQKPFNNLMIEDQ